LGMLVEDAEPPATALLDLPDEVIKQALARACSVLALASLASACKRLRALCLEAAAALLAEACAAASTQEARALIAATIHNLARMCGRHPVIPEAFLAAAMHCESIGQPPISMAALQRLFIVFADERRWLPSSAPIVGPHRVSNAALVTHAAGSYASGELADHLQTSHVDRALRCIFKAHTKGCKRTRAMLDYVRPLELLNDEDAPDDDPSPDYEPGPDPEEPPEEEGVVGVTIDGVWYVSKEDYFEDDANFGEGGKTWGGLGVPTELCSDGLCAHMPSPCLRALPVFERAVAQRREESEFLRATMFGLLPVCARRYPPHDDAHPISSRKCSFTLGLRYQKVDEEQARGVSKLAHELACDLAATPLSPCACKAVVRDAQLRKRREAWREDGLRRPGAKLRELGCTVVEGVIFTGLEDAVIR